MLKAGKRETGFKTGKLVSVILNPVTLLDLHSFRPVVYKDVLFPVLCCKSPLDLRNNNNNNRTLQKIVDLKLHCIFVFFNQAVEVAELQDRIHLRTTYYNYAKHLESTGNISAAIVK